MNISIDLLRGAEHLGRREGKGSGEGGEREHMCKIGTMWQGGDRETGIFTLRVFEGFDAELLQTVAFAGRCFDWVCKRPLRMGKMCTDCMLELSWT